MVAREFNNSWFCIKSSSDWATVLVVRELKMHFIYILNKYIICKVFSHRLYRCPWMTCKPSKLTHAWSVLKDVGENLVLFCGSWIKTAGFDNNVTFLLMHHYRLNRPLFIIESYFMKFADKMQNKTKKKKKKKKKRRKKRRRKRRRKKQRKKEVPLVEYID